MTWWPTTWIDGLQRLADLPQAFQIWRLCKQTGKLERETDQRPGCLNSLVYSYQQHQLWGTLQASADEDWQAILYRPGFPVSWPLKLKTSRWNLSILNFPAFRGSSVDTCYVLTNVRQLVVLVYVNTCKCCHLASAYKTRAHYTQIKAFIYKIMP